MKAKMTPILLFILLQLLLNYAMAASCFCKHCLSVQSFELRFLQSGMDANIASERNNTCEQIERKDSSHVKKLRLYAQLFTGINLTGYYKEISFSNMASIGLCYQLNNKWSLQTDLRMGILSYKSQFTDERFSFRAHINSFNVRIPVICNYEFRNKSNPKSWSIGAGFGYSAQQSTKSNFETIKASIGSSIYYPNYVVLGESLFGVLKAVKYFHLKETKHQIFISLEGNFDLVRRNEFTVTGLSFNPADSYFKVSKFNPANNLLFLSVGINF